MTSLLGAFAPFTAGALTNALSTRTLGRRLTILEEVGSTNAAAMAAAQEGAPDGMLVIAERQTDGRGRLGRDWFSPPRKNLYCSLVLRDLPPPERLPVMPLIAAVAVARAIEVSGGGRPSLKWPNDLLLGGRKVGGILCESGGLGRHSAFVIVGIGLNVNCPAEEFPDQLKPLATSLLIERRRPFDRAVILASVLSELELRRAALLADADGGLLDEYRVRSATIGQRVRIELAGGGIVEGRATGIGTTGALRVQPDAGPAVDVLAGDVVHLRNSDQ